MYYVDQFAGGLTDEQFEEDPRQSTRSRNYFQPNMNIPALWLDVKFNEKTSLSFKSNVFIGQRNSVMFTAAPTVPDTILASTLEYAPRVVDRDYYTSFTNELRVLQHYKISGREQSLSFGARFSDAKTNRKQRGPGTTGTDFDLTLTGPYGLDLEFTTLNYAFFAENLFRVGERLSITPGVRYEIIRTNMKGNIDYTSALFNYDKNRSIPLVGIGFQYKVNELNNIYANWSQAYRPMLYSDITPAASLDVVDPNLIDSKGFNADLGIRGNLNDYVGI
jgi:Fe(3+) dicitrate transport protein